MFQKFNIYQESHDAQRRCPRNGISIVRSIFFIEQTGMRWCPFLLIEKKGTTSPRDKAKSKKLKANFNKDDQKINHGEATRSQPASSPLLVPKF